MKNNSISKLVSLKSRVITRLLFFIVAVVCLGMPDTAVADYSFQSFDMGWYSGAFYDDPSADIVGTGGSVALYYHMGYLTDTKVQWRLNVAHANGLKIIMHVDGVTQVGSDVTAVDAARVTQFVNTFKNHPAIAGWYSADEPSGSTQKNLCQIAYNAVKAADTIHPVYLCSNKSDDNTIVDFAPAYDVLIFDSYVFKPGESECYHLDTKYYTPLKIFKKFTGLKGILSDVSARAAAANRPGVFAGQGFGRTDGYNSRMPTRREHRFQTYFAFHKGAQGILAWEYNCATRSVANTGDPYPDSGQQWLTDVYKPLADEIAIVGDALAAGPNYSISSSVTCLPPRQMVRVSGV